MVEILKTYRLTSGFLGGIILGIALTGTPMHFKSEKFEMEIGQKDRHLTAIHDRLDECINEND